jgi:hypothetical protein
LFSEDLKVTLSDPGLYVFLSNVMGASSVIGGLGTGRAAHRYCMWRPYSHICMAPDTVPLTRKAAGLTAVQHMAV